MSLSSSPSSWLPGAIAVLVVLALYARRFRRLFGRQPVQPVRMKIRIAILLLVGSFLLLRGMAEVTSALAAVAGLAGGLALALFGLRLTRFETTSQGDFYTPHGGIGVALSALLLGRLAYRFVVLQPSLQAAHAAGEDPFSAFQRSPLTAAMFALLIGYYLAYTIGILLHKRAHTEPAAPDVLRRDRREIDDRSR